MYRPPELGIGLTYFPALDPLIQENGDLINVIEIEPQTHWQYRETSPPSYAIDHEIVKKLKSFRQFKIIHSVATPVGSSRSLDFHQIPYLSKMISDLDAVWFSEHLSFNSASFNDKNFKTAFFLPPIQSYKGVINAVRSIQALSGLIQVPMAVENGVNYLNERENELSDGNYVGTIIEQAECGLVLDIHNLWTNEANGRQSIKEFIRNIPLDRVWEIHLAGGVEEDGYWIDAHSGEISNALIEITSQIIDLFPCLSAIVFEIAPSYLSKYDGDLELVRNQLARLHKLWKLRCRGDKKFFMDHEPPIRDMVKTINYTPDPGEWEDTLGSLVLGLNPAGKLAEELSNDPGVELTKKIIFDVRGSSIVKSLKFTTTLLFLMLGAKGVDRLLKRYFLKHTPELFGSKEGKKFAKFLEDFSLPYLKEVITIDCTVLAFNETGFDQEAVVTKDPMAIMNNLIVEKIPSSATEGIFLLRITQRGLDCRTID